MARQDRKPPGGAPRRRIPRLTAEADPATFFKGEGTTPATFAEALAAGLDRHLSEEQAVPRPPLDQQLKKYPPPQAEFDCHGLTAAEAERGLHRFLAEAGGTALRTVRIITGKGLHSPGGAVLRDVVEGELRLLKKKGAIVAFRWEKKEKLRSGSVVVYL
jgi:DNA-nicking Smr family endonuclease